MIFRPSCLFCVGYRWFGVCRLLIVPSSSFCAPSCIVESSTISPTGDVFGERDRLLFVPSPSFSFTLDTNIRRIWMTFRARVNQFLLLTTTWNAMLDILKAELIASMSRLWRHWILWSNKASSINCTVSNTGAEPSIVVHWWVTTSFNAMRCLGSCCNSSNNNMCKFGKCRTLLLNEGGNPRRIRSTISISLRSQYGGRPSINMNKTAPML